MNSKPFKTISLSTFLVLLSCKTRDFSAKVSEEASGTRSISQSFQKFGPEGVIKTTTGALAFCFGQPNAVSLYYQPEHTFEQVSFHTRLSSVTKLQVEGTTGTHSLSQSCQMLIARTSSNPFNYMVRNLKTSAAPMLLSLPVAPTASAFASFHFSVDDTMLLAKNPLGFGMQLFKNDVVAGKLSEVKKFEGAAGRAIENPALSAHGSKVFYQQGQNYFLFDSQKAGAPTKLDALNSILSIGSIRSSSVNDDGLVAISDSKENFVLFDSSKNKLLAKVSGLNQNLGTFSSSNDFVISTSLDKKKVFLRSIDTFEVLQTLDVNTELGTNVTGPMVSIDGKSIVIVNPNAKNIVVFQR